MSFLNKREDGTQKEKRAVFKYFEIIFSKAWTLIKLNLIYFLCILPLFCGALYFICGIFSVSPELIQEFYFLHLSLWLTANIPFPILLVLVVVSAFFYGPVTAGFTYCIRNIATEKHLWISDFFAQVKANFRQGFVFGLADIIVFLSCMLYLAANPGSLEGVNLISVRIAQIVSLIITIVYIWVRFYSYTIAVTFDLKIKDIFKNSLIFCVLGFFRNIIATLVSGFIIFTFISTDRVDIVLIIALIFALCRFTSVFSTYPIVDKYIMKKATEETQKNQD